MARLAFRSVVLLVVVYLSGLASALTPNAYFTAADKDRLKGIFLAASPYGSDLQSVYYSVLGLTTLQADLPGNPADTCEILKKNVNSQSIESIFHASSVAAMLKHVKATCQLNVSGADKLFADVIASESSTTEELYYTISSMTNLNNKVDSPKFLTALIEALKRDDSALSTGYAFQVASLLSGDVSKIFDLIEDVVHQADEVDEKYLQFEGGLFTTAFIIDGAYKLAVVAKKAPAFTGDAVLKFTNYLLSRKHVQLLKNAAAVLSAVKMLANNPYQVPITVTQVSQVAVSDVNPMVQVRVSNLLGEALGKLTVTADQGRHIQDDAVVLSKKPFQASSDPAVYELNFLDSKPAPGFYKISISVAPVKDDSKLLGLTGAEVEVKVMTEISVESAEVGIADRDQTSATKMTKLHHGQKSSTVLELDQHQKLLLKFQLKASGSNFAPHQTFVRLTNEETKQEIAFVAEPDSKNNYKFDLDIGNSAKEFGYLSGTYSMSLIVGDAVIQNPFSWHLADVALSFTDGAAPQTDEQKYRYSKRPEIKHMFAVPEKRPPALISNIFTGILLFLPVILFFTWIRLGANLSNFSFSLSTFGFHICLAGIFGVYFLYFLRLNMFETLRYVGILSIPTFLFGNRLLSSIAAKQKK